MTDMPRRSVTVSKEVDDRILALRATEKYKRASISEITRDLIVAGLKQVEKKAK